MPSGKARVLGSVLLGAGLALHGAGGAVAWILLPHGFPVDHVRFWSNEIAPIALVIATLAGIGALCLGRVTIARAVGLALASAWLSGAIAARVVYPISLNRASWGHAALAGVAASIVFVKALPKKVTIAIVPGVALGLLMTLAQRAPEPDTHACGEVAVARVDPIHERASDDLELAPGVIVERRGAISVVSSRVRLEVRPLLTFESRSPDRCWTLFAPWPGNFGDHRLCSPTSVGSKTCKLRYVDDGTSEVEVHALEDGASIEAASTLAQPVFSHLNSFLEITVSGHSRLEVAFSPCPTPISIEPSDYPVGRPERIGYLDSQGFHVVEATSGEKGPFRTLASGAFERRQPLVLTFIDAKQPVFEVTIDDWARQSSFQLSPTAGWGLPVNAVEMRRAGDDARAPCHLSFALAASSVGRGWDSVGHASGTYRDRVRVKRLRPRRRGSSSRARGRLARG